MLANEAATPNEGCGFRMLAAWGVANPGAGDRGAHKTPRRSIPDYFRIIWVIEIFSILSDTQPVMLLVLKGCGKKSLVKTVPSDSKCQIPTFSSILP